jgi:hypothetical protein
LAKRGKVGEVGSRKGELYELHPAPMEEMKKYIERVSDQWDAELGRLKRFVEG